jgi:hypothetical protein
MGLLGHSTSLTELVLGSVTAKVGGPSAPNRASLAPIVGEHAKECPACWLSRNQALSEENFP